MAILKARIGIHFSRCVNGGRFSNGKKKSNINTKNGNKYLAWAFVEAANFAIRYSDTISANWYKHTW